VAPMHFASGKSHAKCVWIELLTVILRQNLYLVHTGALVSVSNKHQQMHSEILKITALLTLYGIPSCFNPYKVIFR
jgi:hypothetical protein